MQLLNIIFSFLIFAIGCSQPKSPVYTSTLIKSSELENYFLIGKALDLNERGRYLEGKKILEKTESSFIKTYNLAALSFNDEQYSESAELLKQIPESEILEGAPCYLNALIEYKTGELKKSKLGFISCGANENLPVELRAKAYRSASFVAFVSKSTDIIELSKLALDLAPNKAKELLFHSSLLIRTNKIDEAAGYLEELATIRGASGLSDPKELEFWLTIMRSHREYE